MPLMAVGNCFRKRTDCKSFHVIEGGIPDDVTDEQLETLAFAPGSFVCCGLIALGERGHPQDAYRLCFKNSVVDQISDNDEQDLVHQVAVISTALAVVGTRRVNRGSIDVPKDFDDDAMMHVNTKQGVLPAHHECGSAA